MTPDINVRESQNTRPGLRLRIQQFDLITRVLGCESDTERAELTGLTYRTILRARRGHVVGEVFVAHTIAAFQRHQITLHRYGIDVSMDELFEVVEPETTAEVAA